MVGVYKIQTDYSGNFIRKNHKKIYLKDFNKLGITAIIDYNNGWVIFK